MRFDDLIGVSRPPHQAAPASRRAMVRERVGATVPSDPRNSGFVTGLVDPRHGRRLRPGRRGFLRGSLTALAAAAAAAVTHVGPTARRVEAQTGVVGTYPRRILQFCPPYNASDNCQPGCGSSPICTDCCDSDGFFRNDPANGYTLYAGGCGDGDIADGWIWRYQGVCGNCSTIEYRCSDGYVRTDTGPAPFICRVVTDCVPLADGQEPGADLPDAAQSTSWRPAGALELAVDNGGYVTLTGWVADARSRPVDIRITADGQIVHFGQASLARPDIAASVRGAGPSTGYSLTLPMDPGAHRFCVEALNGAIARTISCVTLDVGSGQAIRGGTVGSIQAPASPGSGDTETTPVPGEVVIPDHTTPSPGATIGTVQVIRRVDEQTGFTSGWAGDLDVDDPAVVEVLVGGASAAIAHADLPRPDVAATFASIGPTTGFALEFPMPSEAATVCVTVISPDDGSRRVFACQTVGAALDTESESDPEPAAAPGDDAEPVAVPTGDGYDHTPASALWGQVDQIAVDGQRVSVTGWAVDAHAPTDPVKIEATILGGVHRGTTGKPHNDSKHRYGFVDAGFSLDFIVPPGRQEILVEAVASSTRVVLDQQVLEVP